MVNLADVLRANPLKSPWATWLAKRAHPGAHDILAFLELGLSRLSLSEQRRVVHQLQSDVADNVDAVLYQLMAFEVCHRLGMQPEYEPKYGSKTPDLRIRVGRQRFAAEAFRCSRPQNTLVPNGYHDAGETARKIRQGIEQKASKYKDLSDPLVVLALYAGNDVDHQDLEHALFGSNGLPERLSLDRDCHESWQLCGVMCPRLGGIVPFSHLSAVIGFDWFDSLNKSRRGRRLHPIVFHHWQPTVHADPAAFAPFCQVRWRREGTVWLPLVDGDPDLVMSTGAPDELEYGPYSPAHPW